MKIILFSCFLFMALSAICQPVEMQIFVKTVTASNTQLGVRVRSTAGTLQYIGTTRSEEHTSELQSHVNLVCRLLLEKKNTVIDINSHFGLTLTLVTIFTLVNTPTPCPTRALMQMQLLIPVYQITSYMIRSLNTSRSY